MGLIQTSIPHLWKPPAATLDWSNGLLDPSLLQFAYFPDGNLGESQFGANASDIRDGVTYGAADLFGGPKINTAASGQYVQFPLPEPADGTQHWSMSFRMKIGTLSSNSALFSWAKNSNDSSPYLLYTGRGGTVQLLWANSYRNIFGAIAPGQTVTFGIAHYYEVPVNYTRLFLDGVFVSEQTGYVIQSGTDLFFGDGFGTSSDGAIFDYLYYTHGRLSDAQMLSLAVDPYQLLEPQRRLIPVGVPGVAPGGNPTISLHPASPIIDATEAEIAAGGQIAFLGIADGLFKTNASLTTAERQQFIAGCQDISTAANRVEWDKVIAATQADADARVVVSGDQLTCTITFAPTPTYDIATDAEIRFIAPSALYTADP